MTHGKGRRGSISLSSGMSRVRKPLHRGAGSDPAAFAQDFVRKRLTGFEKDMRICLTGVPHLDDPTRETHAYFPALMACCGTLEYLAGLSQGKPDKPLGHDKIAVYAARYMNPAYNADIVRILWEAFRHKVAHHGISSGVWLDREKDRRVTWKIEEGDVAPALLLVEETGILEYDPPWPTAYTHRMHIRLGRLWQDIRDSAHRYLAEHANSHDLQENFEACMRHLYPRSARQSRSK